MSAEVIEAVELRQRIGQEIGLSEWIEVSQALINLFADATMDHQFIHVDAERASRTPFGGTIAHGFLSLSLLSRMSFDALRPIENAEMGVNYGLNRLRFLAPVKAGDRVRGRFLLHDVADKGGNQLLLTYEVTVEIEGGSKPALAAEWLTLFVLRGASMSEPSGMNKG